MLDLTFRPDEREHELLLLVDTSDLPRQPMVLLSEVADTMVCHLFHFMAHCCSPTEIAADFVLLQNVLTHLDLVTTIPMQFAGKEDS